MGDFMKKKICAIGMIVLCFAGIIACNNDKGSKEKETSGAEVTSVSETSSKKVIADERQDVSSEIQALFEQCFGDDLKIVLTCMGEEADIEYLAVLEGLEYRCELLGEKAAQELCSQVKFEKLKKLLFDETIWYEESDMTIIQEACDLKEINQYYSFLTSNEEWIFIEDSNIVTYSAGKTVKYYSLWSNEGDAVYLGEIEEASYLLDYGMPQTDVASGFEQMWERTLVIEHHSEYGTEQVSFDKMFTELEQLYEARGTVEYKELVQTYFEVNFPGIMQFSSTKWYKEKMDKQDIVNKTEKIKSEGYYRFFTDDAKEWLISADWDEAVYIGSDESAYYTIMFTGEKTSPAFHFKTTYDSWMIEGIYGASMYECVVSDSEMTDEELAQKMFEKYAECYVSAKSDNFYGASDMKIVLLKCMDGIDLDGREINDTHKVFTISYAFKANFPDAYSGVFDYGTGEFADWIMMVNDFCLDKIDGVWHLTGVGLG